MHRLASLVFLLALTRASLGLAQDANYQPYPMGERALGMGGAFAAMAGDAISSYYNPAGLVGGPSTAISASLNVYGMTSRVIQDGAYILAFEPDPADPEVFRPVTTDLEFREFPPASIPISTVIVRRLGGRDEYGSRRHAFAWSTLFPRARDLQYSLDYSHDFDSDPTTAPDEHRISYRETDKLMLVGASYAYRISSRVAMGVSIFCGIRTISHSYHHTFFNVDPDHSGIFVRELDISSTVYTGIFRIGALFRLTQTWRLGLMVALPSFEIYSEGRYSARDLETFTGGFQLEEDGDAKPHDLQPLEVRIGIAREVPGSYVLSLDVSFYAPSNYDRFDAELSWVGYHWNDRIRRGAIANVAIGGEVIVAQHWPIRLGFFTDLSAAPEVEASNNLALARVHSFGATLSVGYEGERFAINVGLLGSLGTGQAHTLGPVGPGHEDTYVPTRAQERRFYFVISGARAAAERLLGDVMNRIDQEE